MSRKQQPFSIALPPAEAVVGRSCRGYAHKTNAVNRFCSVQVPVSSAAFFADSVAKGGTWKTEQTVNCYFASGIGKSGIYRGLDVVRSLKSYDRLHHSEYAHTLEWGKDEAWFFKVFNYVIKGFNLVIYI